MFLAYFISMISLTRIHNSPRNLVGLLFSFTARIAIDIRLVYETGFIVLSSVGCSVNESPLIILHQSLSKRQRLSCLPQGLCPSQGLHIPVCIKISQMLFSAEECQCLAFRSFTQQASQAPPSLCWTSGTPFNFWCRWGSLKTWASGFLSADSRSSAQHSSGDCTAPRDTTAVEYETGLQPSHLNHPATVLKKRLSVHLDGRDVNTNSTLQAFPKFMDPDFAPMRISPIPLLWRRECIL